MKQILQNLKTGELMIESVPAPGVRPGHLLIQTSATLISAGTERMLVDFGRANLLDKARQQPEKVKQVIRKLKTDGILPTLEAIYAKLDQPLPLGYCNVGRVLAVGDGVAGYQVGDRVVSNGNHAEVVCIPKNLCAPIPEKVSDEQATFTVISAIGLQGIRLLNPSLGENIVVFGLGLIGLVTVQLLRANGARVLGFDYDPSRVALARSFGVEALDLASGVDPIQAGMAFSGNMGVDGVLVTAATKSNELMHQAAQMCRQRGRIVLTGVTGLSLDRADFYEKELTFQVSCSYGPGRYDPFYEDDGNDYPVGFVRWTENRNFLAILDMISSGNLDVGPMVSHRFSLDQAKEAYDLVAQRQGLGLILNFPEQDANRPTARTVTYKSSSSPKDKAVIGVIGAGGFTQLKVLPSLVKSGADLRWIASAGGVTGTHAAKKFGFAQSTTDYHEILRDPEVNAVLITTRHNSHANLVIRSLEAGKHVFVEKPLCLTEDELIQIKACCQRIAGEKGSVPILMVGFNRRFSPLSQIIRQKSGTRANPLTMTFLCNAGMIPANHWVHQPEVGGGRIIGEACHFIDLFRFYCGSPIKVVSAFKQAQAAGADTEDNVSINLLAEDGSVGNINYFSNGDKSFPKERAEVFWDGKVLSLDNFKALHGYGIKGFSKKKLMSQDKGHQPGFQTFVDAVRSGNPAPISIEEVFNVTEATFAAVRAMREKITVTLG